MRAEYGALDRIDSRASKRSRNYIVTIQGQGQPSSFGDNKRTLPMRPFIPCYRLPIDMTIKSTSKKKSIVEFKKIQKEKEKKEKY